MDEDNHLSLIELGIVEFFQKLLKELIATFSQNNLDLSLGCTKLTKSLSKTLLNISLNEKVQEQSLRKNMIPVLQECIKLKDYDVLTNAYTGLGSFVLS
mmetsp:Transcript_9028/g.8458  ORF Transcript_9028/g.8458 Transcript_9028/m.8458 type:complete len:99 (+) Transcript_9028:527-823(+)